MITLHDYWRSGTSHRVRIALYLKAVAFRQEPVDLRLGAHRDAAFRALNPQGLAPALVLENGAVLTQSPAILEWLEETHPAPALLPADPLARAKVRAIANVVACDIHPLGNLRVLNALRDDHAQPPEAVTAFARKWCVAGFEALEGLLAAGPGGPWCWGDAPTLADCCVVPQIYAAVSRYDVDMAAYPRLAQVEAAAAAHPAFQRAHPEAQPDAPPSP